MRHILFLLGLSVLAGADSPPARTGFVYMREGIGGGYAPEPARFMLVAVGDRVYWMDQAGYHKRVAVDLQPVYADLQNLGMFGLPQIQGECNEDVYAQNAALMLRVGERQWKHNPAPSCMIDRADWSPTAEQLEVYRRGLERVKGLAQGGQPSTQEEMDRALEQR